MSTSIITQLNEILNSLDGVKTAGNGFLAHCPAHEDEKQSLSISQGDDGRVLLYCHAGCETQDIAKALGLEMKELFPVKDAPQFKRQVVKTYDYHNENGELLFQVCRTNEKGFFQRRPDGNGGFINGLGATKPIPYRLPQVKQAIAEGKLIFIPEGEKDVDKLEALGLTATTNPMGAGKWREHYSDYLKGSRAVILPDNDKPGKEHAENIAKSLHGKAASVKVLGLPELPEKGDISDWINRGGTVAELKKQVLEAPEWQPSKTKASKKQKDDEQKKIKQVSFYKEGDCLYEQIYNEGHSYFIEYNFSTGEFNTVYSIEKEEEIIMPLEGEELELGAVKLPSDMEEYGDTLTLLTEIEQHIEKYLDVSTSFRKFASYYILLSWLYDKFNTLPYLRFIGDTGCGKSRALDICGGLCYKPASASGCITPAPIYRMLKRWAGSLILDEADLKNSDEYNEVITILNCGFERGRPVIRATKDNPDKLQFLPTYGPKVYATRQRFKDPALEARCLTEIMQETTRDNIPALLNSSFYKEQEELRNKLLLFRFQNYSQVDLEAVVELDLKGIEPRLKQVSGAFAVLFANQPEVLRDYQEFIKEHQRELIEQRLGTPPGQVVETFFELLSTVMDVTNVTSVTGETLIPVSSKDSADKLNMTPQAVGQILKTMGLQAKVSKVEGKSKRCFVYDKPKLETLRRRYIPQDDEVTEVTKVTSVTGDNADFMEVEI